MAKMTKYIVVSGGVISGIGKGVIGALNVTLCVAAITLDWRYSVVDGPLVEDDGAQGHGDKD